MKKVPLFDLGNVLVRVDFNPFIDWLTERSESKDREKASAILRSSLFYDFEFGNLSREAFTKRLSNLYRADFSLKEVEEKFCSIFPGLVDGMEELLQELAAEGPVYCLSNTNELHLSHLRERYPCMAAFTKLFASHEMRKRKPYPGIYRDVAHELNVDPRDITFFDDVHANVQGAIRAGLDAHLFESALQVRGVLKSGGKTDDKE